MNNIVWHVKHVEYDKEYDPKGSLLNLLNSKHGKLRPIRDLEFWYRFNMFVVKLLIYT